MNYLQVYASFFLGLFLDLEDGGDMFLRIIGWIWTDYITLRVYLKI
jgi:hypothetical protein